MYWVYTKYKLTIAYPGKEAENLFTLKLMDYICPDTKITTDISYRTMYTGKY